MLTNSIIKKAKEYLQELIQTSQSTEKYYDFIDCFKKKYELTDDDIFELAEIFYNYQ